MEDATEEDREGGVKGNSEEQHDIGKKYEMYIGLIIRIKIEEIWEMKKGNNEWSTVRWIESKLRDKVKNEDVKWKMWEHQK